MIKKSTSILLLASASIALVSCGGSSSSNNGSSSSGGNTSSPPASQAPTFTPAVFEASSTFENRCDVVRTGTDSEGNIFPDRAGSTLEENHWLRSWSNETYLWNREIQDQNPASFSSPVSYFAELRTFATTASGEDKDDFHFSQPTAEFLERRNNTASSGYGVRFRGFSSTPPRDFRVLFTEPNSPASEVVNGRVQLPRGARIISIDGEDFINGNNTDILNDGLFPVTDGETHTFVIREAGSTSDRTITLVSESIAPEPVNRTEIINTSSGPVAYMLFNTFSPFASEESLATAITDLNQQNVNDLVLDLRYNGGGLLAVAAQLGYQIAGPQRTNNRTFSMLQYNEDANGTDPTSGNNDPVEPIPFIDTGVGFSVPNGQALSTLNLPRVFILSTGGTCSASEAVINALRGIDVEVVLIGDITCGKPFGFLPTGNCGETYFTIQFRGINDKGFGDYSDGFVPEDNSFTFGERLKGCTIPDDLNNELGDQNEALLSAALFYRDNNSCPVVSTKTTPNVSFAKTALDYDSPFAIIPPEDLPQNSVVLNNMDATMPEGFK